MSRMIELSDEEYARLEQVAREQRSTISELVRAWISSMSTPPSEQRIREAQARWAASGASAQPTEDELRAHPILRASGILKSGKAGWAADHDEFIAEPAEFEDPWQGFYGAFESDRPDLSERHDYYMGQKSLHPHSHR